MPEHLTDKLMYYGDDFHPHSPPKATPVAVKNSRPSIWEKLFHTGSTQKLPAYHAPETPTLPDYYQFLRDNGGTLTDFNPGRGANVPTVQPVINHGRVLWLCPQCHTALPVQKGKAVYCIECPSPEWKLVASVPAAIESGILQVPGWRDKSPLRNLDLGAANPLNDLANLQVRAREMGADWQTRHLSIGIPRTWAVGETLTATKFNSYLSDILNDLRGANGTIQFVDAASFNGAVTVGGTGLTSPGASINGALAATGAASFSGGATVTGNAVVSGIVQAEELASTDDATVADDLTVGGDISVGGDVTITGSLNVGSASFARTAVANCTAGANSGAAQNSTNRDELDIGASDVAWIPLGGYVDHSSEPDIYAAYYRLYDGSTWGSWQSTAWSSGNLDLGENLTALRAIQIYGYTKIQVAIEADSSTSAGSDAKLVFLVL